VFNDVFSSMLEPASNRVRPGDPRPATRRADHLEQGRAAQIEENVATIRNPLFSEDELKAIESISRAMEEA
jgi:hypothetical protein